MNSSLKTEVSTINESLEIMRGDSIEEKRRRLREKAEIVSFNEILNQI
jgi:hypothetical protein